MRRIAAVVLLGCLACLACAGCQRPDWVPNSDLFFQDRQTWFSNANNGDQLLPPTPNDAKPAAKTP
jgi:hypothetical protein